MRTLLETLYGLMCYLTEDMHHECAAYLGLPLFTKLNLLCTELGEWLDDNK